MEWKNTHCSSARPTDPGSRSPRHTSSCRGYIAHQCTGTRGCCSALSSPAAVPHSLTATHQIHQHSPCLHRSATRLVRTPSCCTGRPQGCRWVWGRRPHQSHLGSRCHCRRQRRWIYTGRCHNETRRLCTVWLLWWVRRWRRKKLMT